MIHAMNLISGHRRQARRRAKLVRTWLAALVGLGLCLVALVVGARLAWGVAAQHIADQGTAVKDKLGQVEAQLEHLQAQVEVRRKTLRANEAVTAQPDYSLLLGLLAKRLPEDVILRRCAFTPMPSDTVGDSQTLRRSARTTAGGSNRGLVSAGDQAGRSKGDVSFTVTVWGYAKTHHAFNRYVLALEQVGLFSRVHREKARRGPVPGANIEAVSFQLRCDVLTPGDHAAPNDGARSASGVASVSIDVSTSRSVGASSRTLRVDWPVVGQITDLPFFARRADREGRLMTWPTKRVNANTWFVRNTPRAVGPASGSTARRMADSTWPRILTNQPQAIGELHGAVKGGWRG